MRTESSDAARPKVKGVIVQHLCGHLDQAGLHEKVRQRLPTSWASALDEVPFMTDWVDLRMMGPIVYALHEAAGPEAVFEALRHANRVGTVPRIQPILDGIVRLFGLSPASVFSRMHLINQATTRGVECQWTPDGTQRGRLTLLFAGPIDPPSPWGLYSSAAQQGWAGSMQVVFDVCDVRGRVEPLSARPPTIELSARW